MWIFIDTVLIAYNLHCLQNETKLRALRGFAIGMLTSVLLKELAQVIVLFN